MEDIEDKSGLRYSGAHGDADVLASALIAIGKMCCLNALIFCIW